MKRFAYLVFLIFCFCLTGCSEDLNGTPEVGEKITIEVYGKDENGFLDVDDTEKVSGIISRIREDEEYYYIYLENDPIEYQLIK